MSALQVLRQPRTPMDNVQLTTRHPGPHPGLAAQGRCVRFNWVPSHIGVRGNEGPMRRPGSATIHPRLPLTVLPSIQGAKVLARRAAICAAEQQYRHWCRHRGRQPGTNKPRKTTSRYAPPSTVPSRGGRSTNPLRLGYVTLDELRDGFEERPCGTVLI
ncbi:hypothetical protein GWK47_018393 [Chionoecetes opilio]|uniref:Uncharacterized protein n=1 Tax=Chionoecetes opilio TaxID=41210 RepID=A0A8J5CJE8_CHIOP|nr:hypothetical protein GWK47_018393 [Chionoecetes opilio]